MVADGSYIPANVSRSSWMDIEEEVQFSMHSYLYDLDAKWSEQTGLKNRLKKRLFKKNHQYHGFRLRLTLTTEPSVVWVI